MIRYLIDGNNLIGKIPKLRKMQKLNPQASREQLVFLLDRYFSGKKVDVSLHFDGFPKNRIQFSAGKITYSNLRTADENIKLEIDRAKNPKLISVISSDHSVYQYAKLNACSVIKSENFASKISSIGRAGKTEEDITKTISDDEMKRLFGV